LESARRQPEAGDFDRRAAVHHDREALRFGALADPPIRALTRRVRMRAAPPESSAHGASPITVTVDLAHGRQLTRSAEDGTLAAADLGDKFVRLTRGALGVPVAAALFERLQRLSVLHPWERANDRGLRLRRRAAEDFDQRPYQRDREQVEPPTTCRTHAQFGRKPCVSFVTYRYLTM